MIYPTKDNSTLCFSDSVVHGVIGFPILSGNKRNAPSSSHDDVLQDLFRARLDRPILPERCSNVRPRRAAPLMSMSGPSLFDSKKTEWNPSSLFHQLGQQKSLKPMVSDSNSTGSSSDSSNAPFPWHSTLFATPPPTSASPSTLPNNTRPVSMTGDLNLDERIRSLSTSLRMTTNQRCRMGGVGNRKRPRNQATRHRLVGQVLGQKGVQKVVAVVKELKEAQASLEDSKSDAVQNLRSGTVLVEAWENTPVNDLKSLPWEEMLQTSLQHLEAYNTWKAANK